MKPSITINLFFWSLLCIAQCNAQTSIAIEVPTRTFCVGKEIRITYIGEHKGLLAQEEIEFVIYADEQDDHTRVEKIVVLAIDAENFDKQSFLVGFNERVVNFPLKGIPLVLIRLKNKTAEHVTRINELLVASDYITEIECVERSIPDRRESEFEQLERQEKLKQEEARRLMGASFLYNKALKFVPGLRPSTGRRNAAHFYTA